MRKGEKIYRSFRPMQLKLILQKILGHITKQIVGEQKVRVFLVLSNNNVDTDGANYVDFALRNRGWY